MELANLGLVGNCQIAAHIAHDGSVVWCCLPRFDAPPVFGALLDEGGGRFQIGAADGSAGRQRYLPNTNILETTFETNEGAFRVLDFAPRFIQYDRSFRPKKLVRIVEPISGMPRVRVVCDPVLGWSKARPRRTDGSNHISFDGYAEDLRLTTDVPLSYIGGNSFALTGKQHFVLAWGNPVEESLRPLCEQFLARTTQYWQTWVKHCDIPSIFQEEVLRSALALKLHCFEDTGAIVASLTSSIPEAPGSGRTWDYRYCWLRDAFYALDAFRLLGHFEEREQFLQYLLNIVAADPTKGLAPLYRIDGRKDVEETILRDWSGFQNQGPVRVGNEAGLHQQHDVYGEVILALTPLFIDPRFRDQVSEPLLDVVEGLARRAALLAGTPDAGIWELRTEWKPQTFSSLMCWAATDRMAKIARIHRPAVAEEFAAAAARIHQEILTNATDPVHGNLTSEYGSREVDASLLQAITLGFFGENRSAARATIAAIRRDLERNEWLLRYRTDDGFGVPEVAFAVCTFWLVEALARVGQEDEAREVLERCRAIQAPLGLLAEDVAPTTGKMWGNFPQAYSHVGCIHAAFAADPRW